MRQSFEPLLFDKSQYIFWFESYYFFETETNRVSVLDASYYQFYRMKTQDSGRESHEIRVIINIPYEVLSVWQVMTIYSCRE